MTVSCPVKINTVPFKELKNMSLQKFDASNTVAIPQYYSTPKEYYYSTPKEY